MPHPSDSDQEDSETTIVYNDSSLVMPEDLNICYACFGDEHWNENEKWVGCNSSSDGFINHVYREI